MKYTLKSDDDEMKFHTLSGMPYPFDGLTIIIYNGAQDWKKNPPKSEEEAHRYIQKRSMENGTGLVEVSQMILSLMREG